MSRVDSWSGFGVARAALASIALLAVAGGCQSTMLSDGRIASNTAGVIGASSSDLAISERRSDATHTYYVATTKDGKAYACVIAGGGALDLGLTKPPSCNPRN